MPDKEEALEVEGVVTQALANTRFRVRLDSGGAEVMAHVAGRMRKHFICGDAKVKAEFLTYMMRRNGEEEKYDVSESTGDYDTDKL